MSGQEEFAKIAVEFASEAVDTTLILEIVKEFAYQGYDAARVIELVKEKGGDKWKEDVKTLIVIALTRGNKPTKIMEKMSTSGKIKFRALVAKYGLKSGNPGRDDLTLARIASAFAAWTIQAIKVVESYLPVTGAAMDELSAGYPRPMMHPCFGGLIDNTLPEETVTALVKAHSLFLDAFSRTINPSLRSRTKAEVAKSFEQPLNAAINSRFLSSDAKRKILKSAGVIDTNLKPAPAVEQAAKKFTEMA
ncbi:nucleoprotein [Medjerda Valley virus]|uniref:Nucleoprotein n=1 Tax=Medjerda Valley virus TaxID=1775957 RepID=A0A0U4HCQ0_9VIRU|nr:nucleoprotein [Medjerda Valley virus]AGA82739.1 nucleoprotein [Arbia virus]ALX81179.1 nucleoprotein [Medjerda Valley virus]